MDDIFKEFASAGLIKNHHVEQFNGKDEVTTSANIATGMMPFFSDDQEEDEELEETFDEEEGLSEEKMCEKIHEAVSNLAEVYEMISGKSLGEMFCPTCTKNDMRDAFDSDGNQSPSDNTPNAQKRGDYEMHQDRGASV